MLALMTLILGIGAIAYSDVMRLSSAQGRYRQRRAAAEYFLRDSDPQLLLRGPDGASVSYFIEGHTLQRLSATPGKSETKSPLLSDPAMAVQLDLDQTDGDARSVVATVEWEEDPRIGVSHPILSLRAALRGQP